MMLEKGVSGQPIVSDANQPDIDVPESNFRAGEQLAEIVRTTLGPKGLDKLLLTSDGKMVVTNDGASILDRLDIEHPAANLVVEVAKTQDTRAGDGTTSAVILAGELLSGAKSLRERGIHPTKIIEGYHLAATHAKEELQELTVSVDTGDDEQLEDIARTVVTGKWDASGTDFLANRAVEAVRAIEGENRVAFERITRKTIPGGSFYDSEVIDGLVIDLEESSTDVVSPDEHLPASYTDATVALIDEELSTDEPTGIGSVKPDTYGDFEAFREYEQEVYEQYADALTGIGADVVFCQQSIDDPVRYRLAEEGVLAVERTRRDELNKLARVTGAQPVPIDQLTAANVGTATSVERRSVGPTELTVASGFDEFDHMDIIAAHRPDLGTMEALLRHLVEEEEPRRTFQVLFDQALLQWIRGEGEYRETWAAFQERVMGALERVAGSLGSGDGGLVFTSGGTISAIAQRLLAFPPEHVPAFNGMLVNAGITRVVSGRRGLRLASLNEHVFLPEPLFTFR
jgi:broad specificity phosphatase PhoE